MNKNVKIIRKCRIHSRVLLDNGQSEKIPTANAVVGTFYNPRHELISLNDFISNENIPLTKSINQRAETICISGDHDVFIEETEKSIQKM